MNKNTAKLFFKKNVPYDLDGAECPKVLTRRENSRETRKSMKDVRFLVVTRLDLLGDGFVDGSDARNFLTRQSYPFPDKR